MKTSFVADLKPDQTVTTYLLVQSKEVRFKRSGEPYLSLRLSDRSGHLDAKMWDGVGEVASLFDRDDVIKVQGMVQLYRNRLQMTVQRLRPTAPNDNIALGDYLPKTNRDIDEMFGQVLQTVEQMQNAHLKQLLKAFLDDPEIAAKFKQAPAAKSLHHAFIGGLLEHVVSLLNLAKSVAGNYEFIDVELVQTGVILHDMGKIEELCYERAFGYTDQGQLLGHIVIVLRMLEEKLRQIPDFPPKWRLLVEHMIVSHHGKYEFGSPKLPVFPEALLLNHLDDMDSKLESARASLADQPAGTGPWSPYNPSLERALMNKDRFLTGDPVAEEAAEPEPAECQEGFDDESTPEPVAEQTIAEQTSNITAPKYQPKTLFGEKMLTAIQRPLTEK